MIQNDADRHGLLTRLSPLWALTVTVGVLYGSLLPFSFDMPRLLALGFTDVLGLRFRSTNLEDVVTNLVVYLPIGFLAAAACGTGPGRRAIGLLAALLLGLLASLTAESLQLAVSIRVPSLTDVLINAAGALLGAMLAPRLLPRAASAMHHISRTLRFRPFLVVSRIMLVALVAYHLAPFDFLTKEVSLRHAFAIARWSAIPGEGSAADWLTALAGANWFAIWAYFSVLGRMEEGTGPRRSLVIGTCMGITSVTLLEVSQIMIRSHVFEVSDIVLRAAAVIVGASCGLAAARRCSPGVWSRRPALAAPTALIAAMLLVQLASVLAPALLAAPRSGASGAWVLPFESLWRGSMLQAAWSMISDVLRYSLLAATMGLLLRRLGFTQPWWIVTGLVVLAVSAPVWRSAAAGVVLPDLTRPILALLAAVVIARLYPALRPA